MQSWAEFDPASASWRRGFREVRTERISSVDPRSTDLPGLDAPEDFGSRRCGCARSRERDLRRLHGRGGRRTGRVRSGQHLLRGMELETLGAPSLDRDGSFVVLHGERPVSIALLEVDREHKRATNEMTATLPEFRRRGLMRLAKAASLRRGRALASRRSSRATTVKTWHAGPERPAGLPAAGRPRAVCARPCRARLSLPPVDPLLEPIEEPTQERRWRAGRHRPRGERAHQTRRLPAGVPLVDAHEAGVPYRAVHARAHRVSRAATSRGSTTTAARSNTSRRRSSLEPGHHDVGRGRRGGGPHPVRLRGRHRASSTFA